MDAAVDVIHTHVSCVHKKRWILRHDGIIGVALFLKLIEYTFRSSSTIILCQTSLYFLVNGKLVHIAARDCTPNPPTLTISASVMHARPAPYETSYRLARSSFSGSLSYTHSRGYITKGHRERETYIRNLIRRIAQLPVLATVVNLFTNNAEDTRARARR